GRASPGSDRGGRSPAAAQAPDGGSGHPRHLSDGLCDGGWRRNPGADGPAGARRPAHCRRSSGHLLAGAVLLGAPSPLAKAAARASGSDVGPLIAPAPKLLPEVNPLDFEAARQLQNLAEVGIYETLPPCLRPVDAVG